MELDYEKLAQEFEAQQQTTEQPETVEDDLNEVVETPPVVKTENEVQEQFPSSEKVGYNSVLGVVKKTIVKKAQDKISDEKIVDKHAATLKKIADDSIKTEEERARLTVKEKDADNKVRNQEIKNTLIILKAKAKRLKKEEKQRNREQKAEHKVRNNQTKWKLYGEKLTNMKYNYVPCGFVLAMLLFFDGVRSFFDGLGTVSTAIVKALKWIILGGIILIVLFSIPATRIWITNLLIGGLLLL